MLETVLKEADEKMNKAIQVVEHDLGALRSGRASIHMVDTVKVSIYGAETPINQVSTVTTPDASTIMISPWDRNALAPIEKAILQANIGMTPSNDGKVIRLTVPALTQDTRKEMVKKAHAIGEEGRVSIRNVRRHLNDEVKKAEKDHVITEDDSKKKIEQIQKKTDEFIKKIDGLLAAKEKEIMTV